MAERVHPWLLLFLLLASISSVPPSSCQSNLQNIQVFYPSIQFPPVPRPLIPPPSPPNRQPQSPPQPPPKSTSNRSNVVKAVAATAASTLVVSALFFFLLQRRSQLKKKKSTEYVNPYANPYRTSPTPPAVPLNEFTRVNGNFRGVIVDEDGLDVLYWRNLENETKKESFKKDGFDLDDKKVEDKEVINEGDQRRVNKPAIPIQERPLLADNSSSSEAWVSDVGNVNPFAAPPPPTPPTLPPPTVTFLSVPKNPAPAPPPPPPPSMTAANVAPAAPPPPPPIPARAPPPPPPIAARAPPPPPPKPSSKPPQPPPRGNPSQKNQPESSGSGDGNEKVKLKPLHWDKVNPNVEHSMVWDKIDNGSFRFDGDLMEALFGTVAKSPKRPGSSSPPSTESSNRPTQVFILDPRKSQNTAIVLRSLAITRKEIVDALTEGQGLDTETLEKLTRIAPTKEEEAEILAFDADPAKLADAESFLYHILKAVPSAFTRFNAMLFRSGYNSEITHLKEILQTLELGCQELRTRGLFVKLLEAILKAGNRMNAGTSRGNAQAFNLNSLLKLSDVKSTDGKTTLLHFVVEEVVRAEGKRCLINRSRSLSKSTSQSRSSTDQTSAAEKEEKEREYIKLGLPVVGGLSDQFMNVKKAATIDYNTYAKTCSALEAAVGETRQLLARFDGGEDDGFVQEMRSFLGVADKEVKAMKEEQARVMALVKRTTEYYQTQPGNVSKEKEKDLHQLFVIVKDFLGMVDKVCIEVARNLQKRKVGAPNVGTSSPKTPGARVAVRFPMLPENFMGRGSSSSDSGDESE